MDIESFSALGISLRLATSGHAALKKMAAFEDTRDAKRAEEEIGLLTPEAPKQGA